MAAPDTSADTEASASSTRQTAEQTAPGQQNPPSGPQAAAAQAHARSPAPSVRGSSIIGLFAVTGTGIAAAISVVFSQLTNQQALLLGGVVVPMTVVAGIILPPVVGGVIAFYTHHSATVQPLGYASLAVATGIGAGVFILAILLGLNFGTDTPFALENWIIPAGASAGAAAGTSGASAWVLDTLSG